MENVEKKSEVKKITWEKFISLMNLIRRVDLTKRTRFSFLVEKMGARWNKHLKKYTKISGEIDIKYCSTDESHNLIFEEVTTISKNGDTTKQNTGMCRYTKENRKKRDEEVEKLHENEIEISICLMSKEDPSVAVFMEKLSFTELNLLAGTLIDMPEVDFDSDDEEIKSNVAEPESISANGQE